MAEINREKVIKGMEHCLYWEKIRDCTSCQYYAYRDGHNGCVNQMKKEAIALLKEQGWISVEERFPEEPFGCLVTIWDSKPNGGDDFPNILPYFVGWDGEQWNDSDGVQCPFEVIAWMKLPEPYQPKD